MKKNYRCSLFFDLLIGVPKGSILGLVLFNICICDLLFFIEEETVNSYADSTTHFSNGTNIDLKHLTFFTGFRKTTSRQILTNRIFCLHPQRKRSMKIEDYI